MLRESPRTPRTHTGATCLVPTLRESLSAFLAPRATQVARASKDSRANSSGIAAACPPVAKGDSPVGAPLEDREPNFRNAEFTEGICTTTFLCFARSRAMHARLGRDTRAVRLRRAT